MSKLSFWRTICLVCVCCAVEAIGSPAQTFRSLLSFDETNGANPNYLSLVQGTDGNFYGTTYAGGANDSCTLDGFYQGCGTVFKLTPSGTLTTLHSFDSTDGAFPYGLIQGTDGNFYGVTFEGGSSSACSAYSVGCGTVFEITPTGTLTTLHSFDGSDGSFPLGGLVQANTGSFYGTTSEGGANDSCTLGVGCGTVFKLTPSGTLTTLHSFDGSDGSNPLGGLVQGISGDFYGTTNYNGANSCVLGGTNYGCGTVFKISSSGTLTTLLSFDGTDGAQPNWLVQATDGNFYGTTTDAGAGSACGTYGCGTVFEITPAGTLTTLYSFDDTDGSGPEAGLVQATDGNFYGTAANGGAYAYGTAFKITPRGALTTLHSFDSTDGTYPGGLLQGTNGTFYGITSGGSRSACTGGCGTVFSLSVGLRPFVETRPTSGKVGTKVTILGNNLVLSCTE